MGILSGVYEVIGVKVYSTQFNSQCFRPQYVVDWYTRFHMSLPPYVFVAKKSDKRYETSIIVTALVVIIVWNLALANLRSKYYC